MMVGFVSFQYFNDGWFLVSVLFRYKILMTVHFFCYKILVKVGFVLYEISMTVSFVPLFLYEISKMDGFVSLRNFYDVCFHSFPRSQ